MMLSDEDLENYTLGGNHYLPNVVLKYNVICFRMHADITYSSCFSIIVDGCRYTLWELVRVL